MRCSAVLLVLLLPGHLPARAQAPADTLPGQSRFVRRLAATICQRLERASGQQPFKNLTASQADELFSQTMNASSGEHLAELNALLAEARRRHLDAMQTSRGFGRAVVPVLNKTCPSAKQLLLRSSFAKDLTNEELAQLQRLTPQEKAILQPAATNACNKLAAENRRRPLAQRPVAERQKLLNQLILGELSSASKALLQLYGATKYTTIKNTQETHLKIAFLMGSTCPDYMALFVE